MKLRRLHKKKFIAFLFCIILSLAFLPFILRLVFFYAVTAGWITFDDEINRDRLYTKEKAPEIYRIAMVGDSFMHGSNVETEETVPKQVETLLNNNLDCPVEVINFGIPGMKLSAYPNWVDNKISDYHPDLIVYELAPQSFESDYISSLPGSVLGIMFMPLLIIKDNILSDTGTYEHYMNSLNAYRNTPDFNQRFKLQKLMNSCKAAGAQCIGISWPIKLKRHLNRFHVAHDWTVELLRTENIGVVPVWDLYAPHPPKVLNLSIFDPHPTAFANSLVAKAVAQYILDNRMGLSKNTQD